VNAATRREWRELGFFYDRDDRGKSWCIVGTRAGLGAFAECLRTYAANPKRQALSEHEHLGPYMHLKIGTWTDPQINDTWIAGPPGALNSLAQSIDRVVAEMEPGGAASLRHVFAPLAPYDLVLELRPDQFDPASEDKGCW
jgi:hypothetical protein